MSRRGPKPVRNPPGHVRRGLHRRKAIVPTFRTAVRGTVAHLEDFGMGAMAGAMFKAQERRKRTGHLP